MADDLCEEERKARCSAPSLNVYIFTFFLPPPSLSLSKREKRETEAGAVVFLLKKMNSVGWGIFRRELCFSSMKEMKNGLGLFAEKEGFNEEGEKG